jgi:hypothetical protein
MRALLLIIAIIAVAFGWSPSADASHATACNALPASGTCAGTVNFNPRQDCINAIPGHVQGPPRNAAVATCNQLSTSGSRPGTVACNPRAECVAKLPPPPTVNLTSITGGVGGANNTWPQTDDIMLLHGHNVGVPGASVSAQESGFTVNYVEPTGSCTPPDCARVKVSVGAASPGENGLTRHIVVTAPGGHSSSTGTFRIVKQPPPQQYTGASTGTYSGGGVSGSRIISGTSTQNRSVTLQISSCSPSLIVQGGSATCQILASVTGPALPSPITGSVAENMPGVHYINISPASFTIPTGAGSSMLAVGTITLTSVPFNDPNQSPGSRAPGTPGWRTTASFKAKVVWPQSSGSGTSTAEAVSGITVESQ